ncbi:hypothetical protein DUI87_02775 [Hirundo rustica rustica]|uniref:Uncharacterized protein n=1 Tax=Hirundo rustica rustica TaxID=333673 RepID=A0A3M0LD53_HIRRU|nr:hypothetical protein DUI87_02775 [Hirundo rustica rustica]
MAEQVEERHEVFCRYPQQGSYPVDGPAKLMEIPQGLQVDPDGQLLGHDSPLMHPESQVVEKPPPVFAMFLEDEDRGAPKAVGFFNVALGKLLLYKDTRQTPRHGLRLQEPEEKSLDAPLPLVERLRKITLPRDEEDSLKRPAGPLQAADLETPGFIASQEGGSRGGQRVRAIHHPFPQSTIRDLCKAHRDYGRDSPYFRGLLHSDLDAAVVIPADLKQLFSCLLDSTEFKLWVVAWRQQLREALPSLLRDPETAVDDNGNPLTLEHLMGEGRWADPSNQTSDIPIKALQIAREHAVSAFFGMVPDGPVVPYYKIMQGAKESFTKFTNPPIPVTG